MTADSAGSRVSVATALLVGLVLLIVPRPASAGTYDVVACSGGPDNSWAPAADPGMAAYDSCPNNPSNMISGMIARASVGSGSVGYLRGAYQVFTAPPGASLAQMSFTAAPYRWETHWTAGIVAYDWDFNRGDLPWGCYAGQPGCGIVPPSFSGPYTIGLGGHAQVRIEARCGNGSGCTLASTGRYPYTRATIALANVTVRVQDFTHPAVQMTGGGFLSGGWLRGVQAVRFDATDNVGIRETRVSVDGAQVTSGGKPCDYSLRVPCPQGGSAYSLDTRTIRPDGPHTLSAQAIDTAGNLGQVSRTILVDNAPPGQPEGLALEGGEGWRSRNSFRLSWRNPHDGGAPIAGARYSLCPTTGGNCQQGSRDGADVGAIDVQVPREGAYVARLWLRDAAGNEDSKTAGSPLSLRLDNDAPEIAFEGQDPADPTRVAVRAFDPTSGIARGEIEIRSSGSQAWLSLPTKIVGRHLAAYLDDERLPDGTYEFRARAVDHAGNERSTDRRTDGQRTELTLPVRVKTHLRAGVVKRSAVRKRRGRERRRRAARLLTRSRARFGKSVPIAGSVRGAGGRPIAGAEVMVSQAQRKEGATFTLLARLRTSSTGHLSYLVPKGPSRILRLRYPGAPTVRPATTDVKILVSGTTSLAVGRHFALNGETVTFSGRVRGRPIPPSGKLVELQAFVRAAWRTFATAEANARGGWRYRYRFTGTRGRQVYRFRARLPREASYPYESGHSRPIRVTVVGQ
jgi:hypothetical protein